MPSLSDAKLALKMGTMGAKLGYKAAKVGYTVAKTVAPLAISSAAMISNNNNSKGATSSMTNAFMSHPLIQNAQSKLLAATSINGNCDTVDKVKDEESWNFPDNVAWAGWKGKHTGDSDKEDNDNKNFADGVFSLISRYNAVCGSNKRICGTRWARTLREIAKNESRLGKYGVTNSISNAWSSTKNVFSRKPQTQSSNGRGGKYRRKTHKRNRK